MYGKLVKGKLILAPDVITIDNITYKPATSEVYIRAGYKPVTYTPYPADGNIYEGSYEDLGEEIVQLWRLVRELTPSERRENAYQNEKCCVYGEELYTCDELEDLYYKYFAEAGKEDICAALKAAITAGKAHIREEFPDEPPEPEEEPKESEE